VQELEQINIWKIKVVINVHVRIDMSF
jgi:hypothetical protein